MIWKTEKIRKRVDFDWLSGRESEEHVELVKVESWYFLVFPIYSRTTVVQTNL